MSWRRVPWLPEPDEQGRTFDPSDERHGTSNGYINCKCRCDACRAAWRENEAAKAARERYNRRLGHRPSAVVLAEWDERREHGTAPMYRHGCKCADCRGAEAARRRRARLRSKAS